LCQVDPKDDLHEQMPLILGVFAVEPTTHSGGVVDTLIPTRKPVLPHLRTAGWLATKYGADQDLGFPRYDPIDQGVLTCAWNSPTQIQHNACYGFGTGIKETGRIRSRSAELCFVRYLASARR
jgi:hypothetical protein